jgi:hypothetical protein
VKDKTIDCLKLCSMPITMARTKFQEEICSKHTGKVIRTKLDELCRRGYIEYGTSIFGAWLTEKGKHALHDLTF